MERALYSLDSLMKQVRNLRGLPKEVIVDLLCDSVSALTTLKERGIAHRDIKHLNILCPELAVAYAQRQSRTNDNYTREQCDLWSFGCTLFLVATGAFPFPIDAKDTSVYAQAVAKGIRPEGAISAERVCGDNNRYMYKYGYKIENPVYP
ncbi:hypothetical protein TELCIR_23799, partial [Teladorsagia circumcincta]